MDIKRYLFFLVLSFCCEYSLAKTGNTDVSFLFGTFGAGDLVSADENNFALDSDNGNSVALVINHFQRRQDNDRIMYEVYLSRATSDLLVTDNSDSSNARFASDIEFYHIGGIFEFAHTNPHLIPFFGGTLGVTRIVPDGLSSESNVSLSVTGGAKWMPTEHIGLRIEGRVFSTFVDTNTEILCSGGCIARFDSDIWWQYQISAGLTVRF